MVHSALAIIADVEKLIAGEDTNLLTRFIYLHWNGGVQAGAKLYRWI